MIARQSLDCKRRERIWVGSCDRNCRLYPPSSHSPFSLFCHSQTLVSLFFQVTIYTACTQLNDYVSQIEKAIEKMLNGSYEKIL